MTAPIIEVDNNVLEGFDKIGVSYRLFRSSQSVDLQRDYIRIPSGLYVARQRTLLGENWNETHKTLKFQGSRMPTPIEFVEFLRYVKLTNPKIYDEVTQVKSPWTAEWLDAKFEKRKDKMYILTEDGTKAEPLDEDTLMEDKCPGISLDSWLENPTSQGFPREDVKEGELYFWSPRNRRVARFAVSDRAGLFCGSGPFGGVDYLGGRAVRRE